MAFKKKSPRTTLATQISSMKTCSASSRNSKSLTKSRRKSRRNQRRTRRRPILTLTLPCMVQVLFPLARSKGRKSHLLSKAALNRLCIRRRMGLSSKIAALSLSHSSTRFTILMKVSQFMVRTTAMAMFEEILCKLVPSLL